MKAWLNGQYVDWEQTTVPLLSHSFSRGSAIFEVLDIVAGEKGPAYFGLDEHVARFFNSARLSYMDLPLTEDGFRQAHIDAARENQVAHGLAKSFAYYPNIELTALPQNPEVHTAIFCVDFGLFGVRQEDLSAPASVGISSFRKLHPETVPVHAKIVGNYVNAFLAKMEVKKRGYDDVIMLDTMGLVSEGATSNVFLVREGRIMTPPLRSSLPGITRRAVMELVRDMGLPFVETDIRPEDLGSCDEAFYSGSVIKIQPIKAIEGRELGTACPGPITSAVAHRMSEVLAGRDSRFENWLTYI
ncbi:MAG: aminotransferase class IV [Proteobacteria bacterium]|nr:aminotransferase class IV [Pseudomonadota bacterium]